MGEAYLCFVVLWWDSSVRVARRLPHVVTISDKGPTAVVVEDS